MAYGHNKDYVVKDSGVRMDYSTGMRRDTQEGKPRYDLVVPLKMKNHMLKRWATHMTKGAEKYGIRNWELAKTDEEYDRFRASAFRHFIQWLDGEDDEDHAAAVFFNIQCCEYVKDRMEQEASEVEDVIPFSVASTFTEPEAPHILTLEEVVEHDVY